MFGSIASKGALALCLATVAIGTQASATVSFGSASVTTSTEAWAKRENVVKSASETKTTTIASLPSGPGQASSASLATIKNGGATPIQVNAASTATAYFTDATTGSFDGGSSNSIVQAANSTVGSPLWGYAKSGGYNFTYNFSTTTLAIFDLAFILNDPQALAGNMVTASLTGPSGFLTLLTPSTSGSITSWISAGSYVFKLQSGYEDSIARNLAPKGTTVGSSVDHFDFTVTAVPEPATWSMMIVGLGAMGAMLRRSKRTALFAA